MKELQVDITIFYRTYSLFQYFSRFLLNSWTNLMENSSLNNQKIILFDGVCNLCNSSVQWVIERDNNQFKFASLQSNFGQRVLKENKMSLETLDTILLIERGKVHTKSDAAIRIASVLKGWPSLLVVFLPIPKFIRDAAYTLIARNRYRWFGKQESCMLPTPELSQRFIQ